MNSAVSVFFLSFLLLLFPGLTFAQAPDVSIAVTRQIVSDDQGTPFDDVDVGLIVVFDPEQEIYRLAEEGDSAGELGVVVEDALLLFRKSEGVPVANSGTVPVRVSTLGGPIKPGDLIVPSQIPGVGTKALPGANDGLGIARETFAMASSSEPSVEGEFAIAYGTVAVSLAASKFGAFEASDIEDKQEPGTGEERRLVGIALFAAFMARLIAALIITGGAIIFAYRMYEKHVVAGIESVGRNPLAKATIQTMVFSNMALIAVVSAAAIALSIMIVVLPL